MSLPTKELTEVIKDAAALSNTVGYKVLLGSDSGDFGKIGANAFCQKQSYTMPASNGCLRIKNFNTIAVSIRANVGYGAALGFFSSYGVGQPVRTAHKFLFSSEAVDFYINGSSDSSATLYIKSGIGQATTVNVISLDAYYPTIEPVTSIPDDATLLSAT